MKGRRISRSVILTAAAAALTASLSVGSALAYFTTYCAAEGSVTMNMGFTDTEIDETVDSTGKHVTIRNTGEYDCFVRVRVFAPDITNAGYTPGDGWTQDGDYWYYTPVLAPGAETSELLVTYDFPEGEDQEDYPEFNIVAIYECTPVVYDENGNPYGDWDYVITASDTEQEGVEDEE